VILFSEFFVHFSFCHLFALDNAAVHQKEDIDALAQQFGIIVAFLPPYSPGEPSLIFFSFFFFCFIFK